MTIKALKPPPTTTTSPGLHDHQGIETGSSRLFNILSHIKSPGLHDHQGIETSLSWQHLRNFLCPRDCMTIKALKPLVAVPSISRIMSVPGTA